MKTKEEYIEPCYICKMKYNREMCRIADKFFQDEDPCFCRGIKKIQKLINENKRLKETSSDCIGFIMEQDDGLYNFEEWRKSTLSTGRNE